MESNNLLIGDIVSAVVCRNGMVRQELREATSYSSSDHP